MGGVCSVFCRRRDSPPGSWIMVAWLWVVLVVGVEILSLLFFFQCVACVCVWLVVVLGFLLAAHAGALILVCLVVCVRVLCENSIVCQCTFVAWVCVTYPVLCTVWWMPALLGVCRWWRG